MREKYCDFQVEGSCLSLSLLNVPEIFRAEPPGPGGSSWAYALPGMRLYSFLASLVMQTGSMGDLGASHASVWTTSRLVSGYQVVALLQWVAQLRRSRHP